ncbi:hypothetical protein ABB02_00590 [Clostridiaceae bacterium JG1575]|nr:hypothetical protein ABB02_00590 [Clostridiaceae bacterium JG1575]
MGTVYNGTMKTIRVNMISETEFTVKGHGVHTAYVEITRALENNPRVCVAVNATGDFDIVHIQTMGFYSLRCLLRRGGKKVVSGHLVPESFLGSIRGAKHWAWAARRYLKFFYGKADLVLACSGSVAKELRENMHLTNCDILYNSIDMSKYECTEADRKAQRKAQGIPEDAFVILGNGQLQPRKRFDLFVQLANERPEYRFIWVGGIPFGLLGDEAQKMKRLADDAPKNLTVTGVIDLEAVRPYYHCADAFWLPALQENHPMCVLEAAGAGLPIVLRDIPNYKDTFVGGALMAQDDAGFAPLLDRLAQDAAYRHEWADRSKLIKERFDSKNAANRLIDFYESLLDSCRDSS